jgi:hypothetical protein
MKKIKLRKVWLVNPKTRIKKSKKIYQRQKAKQEIKKTIRNNIGNFTHRPKG